MRRPVTSVAVVLSNIVALAVVLLCVCGAVGWLWYEITGGVPHAVVAVGVYSLIVVELGSRLLGRLQQLGLI